MKTDLNNIRQGIASSEPLERVNLRLPSSAKVELEALACRRRTSLSALIRHAISRTYGKQLR
jgi:hypothetical protein